MATASARGGSAVRRLASAALALRLLPAAATVVGVAALLELVYDRFLNYDARYALVWARDLARGLKPDYAADFAPTPHPLETAVSILATPFETAATRSCVWLMLLASAASSGSSTGSGRALHPLGRRRRRARRADPPGARARRAARLPGRRVRAADRRAPCCSRRSGGGAGAGARAAGGGRPDAAGGVGARRALLALDVAGARRPAAGLRYAGADRARAAALGGAATGT